MTIRSQLRRCEAQAPPSFAMVLDVLLQRKSDFVCGHDMQTTLCALLSTSCSTRTILTQWINEQLTIDITRGHESIAIPVVHRHAKPTILQLMQLLNFRYTANVLIPLPRERHVLPTCECERLLLVHTDVARVVTGRCVQLYARYSQNTGWGIYAAHSIARGEYVGEYTGELVSSAEARRRYRHDYDRLGINYILALRERTRNDNVVRTNVDATRFGSYTRFFNHSCEPTLRVDAERIDSFVPRLVFFTLREIERDEQLTFDYGCDSFSLDTRRSVADESYLEALVRGRCHCGASRCRKVMPFDTSL